MWEIIFQIVKKRDFFSICKNMFFYTTKFFQGFIVRPETMKLLDKICKEKAYRH